jgi:pimeloyl-ACP methyl ester carboxylesterase
MSRKDQRIELPDGRALGYDEHGVPDGRPLLHFHGTPSSRMEWHVFRSNALAKELGLRIICLDRPGLGLSDFQPDRRISHWPADVSHLADRLGLERFAVLGYSGGVPYALVCALSIPERLTSVQVAACVGPHDIPGITQGLDPDILRVRRLSVERPRLARFIFRMMGLQARYAPERLIAQSMRSFAEPDRAVMARQEFQAAFVAMVREATRSGGRGAQHDMALMASPWGFKPRDIDIPINLWQGEEDTAASPAMARYLAEVIPGSEARFYAGECHVSLIVNHTEEILSVLAEH